MESISLASIQNPKKRKQDLGKKLSKLLWSLAGGPKARREILEEIGGEKSLVNSLLKHAISQDLVKEGAMKKRFPKSKKDSKTYVLTERGEKFFKKGA